MHFDAALASLAAIHAADWEGVGLAGLARPELGEDPLTQHVAWWKALLRVGVAGRPNLTVQATFAWLEERWPSDPGPAVLSRGDSRLGNVMFGDDGSVAAILGWELATLGPAGLDLGWWLFCDRHHSEGIGAAWPAGFLNRDATLERYAQLAGAEIPHPEWFEAYGGLRFAVLMDRAGNMLLDAGALPPGATMAQNNPATQLLAGMLGVTPPEGEATSFLDSAS